LSTVSLVRLVSHRFLSSHHNVTHFHTHFTTPALSTPALSTPVPHIQRSLFKVLVFLGGNVLGFVAERYEIASSDGTAA